MSYDVLAIVMLLVGCALIVAEVFVPSGGLIAVMCLISFAVSIWSGYKAWAVTAPGYWWTYLAAIIVLIPGTIVGIFRLLENTRFGERILLSAPRSDEVVPYAEEAARLSQLIGRRGESITMLMPGGLVRVDGERLHCTTEGLVIEAGRPVEIMAVRGTHLVVRPAGAEAASDGVGDAVASTPAAETRLPPDVPEEESPLDFDVPQG